MLQWANAKVKAQHDKHHIPHYFQVGDQFWIHLKKYQFIGPYKNLNPLCYGPYIVLEKIGENAFKLSIYSYLGMHLTFNVDLLQPYHASLLEKTYLQTTKLEDMHPYV